jgi:hypothetical protein
MTNRIGLEGNQAIRDAIRRIALHGVVNQSTGAVTDSVKVTGYVAKIHTEGEFAGTVDVQEFKHFSIEESEERKTGYHEGVYLSAIQDNSKGMVIVPKLYSEVTITTDPETGTEYVCMFSHVDVIQLDSHEKVTVGVTEREEYRADDENAPDIEELEETGVFSRTTYLKDSIVSEVQGEKESDKTTQTTDGEKFQVTSGDNESSALINKDGIKLTHGKAESVLSESSNKMEYGSSSVTVKDGTVYLGSESGTDDAVLGAELASILVEIMDCMSQIITTTLMGPQPPVNMAQFIALKMRINVFKNSHSGFLTGKVQVQK